MKKNTAIPAIVLSALLLVGCTAAPSPTPIYSFTATPEITDTPAPTPTVEPTAGPASTPTPEITAAAADPTATPTSAPTASPSPTAPPFVTVSAGQSRTALLKPGTGSLRIRAGKGTSFAILGSIPEGDAFDVLDAGDPDWYRVQYCDLIGYASADYIKLGGPSTPIPTYNGVLDTAVLDGLDNTAQGWGIPMETGGKIPVVPSRTARLFKAYGAFCQMDTTSPRVYLTFDCGYEAGYTGRILDTLKEKNCKAVFFITHDYFKSNAALVRRMIDEGHIVGNHSWTHPNMTKLSYRQFTDEIVKLNDLIRETCGYEMTYFRPPEGVFSPRSLAATQMLGMKTILWDFAYQDWDRSKQPGADYAYDKVMKHIHNGSILLLHAVSSSNTEALPRIIDAMRSAGYEPSLLDA
ncbi:MAG: polysaccharide deacetylase family protein [Eubacteriales bacterium]|nr:polysaccharide deacetylase family protein [Eubacteriales bacterium]